MGYVRVIQEDEEETSGSGFVITPDGKFITCYHVIENAASMDIRFDRDLSKWYPAEFLDGDREADIAILQIMADKLPYTLIAEHKKETRLGENVGLLGYPLGESLGSRVTYTTGVISSIRDGKGGAAVFQIDANAYPGSSGGPLFSLTDGRVVGILQGGINRENVVMINFAICIQEVYKRFLVD